jgi:hypothetical protein
MEWSLLYNQESMPGQEDIDRYVGSSLWQELKIWLHQAYEVSLIIEYSKCGGARGWNMKYRKGGKSLCTLYPMPGCYVALVVIGNREMNETELTMPACCEYTQALFKSTRFACGGKWLMMQVDTAEVLEDVKSW